MLIPQEPKLTPTEPPTSTTTADPFIRRGAGNKPTSAPNKLRVTSRPTTTTRTDTHLAGGKKPVAISTEYLQSFLDKRDRDNRPRIRVSFVGSDEGVSHPVLFDTGSHRSYILLGSGGYRDNGKAAVVSSGGKATFGTDERTNEVPLVRTQRDTIRLDSGRTDEKYSHQINIELAEKIPPVFPDIGLFGASRASDFVRAAGVFSYEPHAKDAGTVVIGDSPARCPSGARSSSILLYQDMLSIG